MAMIGFGKRNCLRPSLAKRREEARQRDFVHAPIRSFSPAKGGLSRASRSRGVASERCPSVSFSHQQVRSGGFRRLAIVPLSRTVTCSKIVRCSDAIASKESNFCGEFATRVALATMPRRLRLRPNGRGPPLSLKFCQLQSELTGCDSQRPVST